MDLDKIERLLDIVAKSGLAEVEVEEKDFKLTVRATAPAPEAAPQAQAPISELYDSAKHCVNIQHNKCLTYFRFPWHSKRGCRHQAGTL